MTGHEMQSQFQIDIAVQQAIIEKTYHIMALQGKLLALTEDIELFRKENADYKDKNDKLNKKVIGYFWNIKPSTHTTLFHQRLQRLDPENYSELIKVFKGL